MRKIITTDEFMTKHHFYPLSFERGLPEIQCKVFRNEMSKRDKKVIQQQIWMHA